MTDKIDDIIAGQGPEVREFVNRHMNDGTLNMHISWGPKAHELSTEERAAEINRVERWLDDPVNNLASKMGGHAFMLRDSGLERTDLKTLEKVKLTVAEQRQADWNNELADLLEKASKTMIELNTRLQEQTNDA